MAIPYGVNINASDMRNIVEKNDVQQDGVRSWRKLLGGASLGYESQADTAKSYYGDATAKAYASNFEQQNAIMGAGLNAGTTKELVSANRQELQSTYDTYIKNYGANLQQAGEEYGKEVGAISQGLTNRATNFSSLYNSTYDYLSKELHKTNVKGAKPVDDEILPNYLKTNGLDWLQDEEGELLPLRDIMSQLKGDDGSLNEKGIEFFDMMFNARPEGFETQYDKGDNKTTRGFGEWLSETNNELYNWATSQDLFNYNFAGTNMGTANVISGRESTDDKYSKTEYMKTDKLESSSKQALTTHNDFSQKAKEAKEAIAAQKEEFANMPSGEKWSRMARGPQNTKEKNLGGDAEKSFNKYKNHARSIVSTLDNDFRTTVGTQTYNEFRFENKELFAEHEKLMNTLNYDEVYSDELAKSIESSYSAIANKMTSFINKKKTTKISGH